MASERILCHVIRTKQQPTRLSQEAGYFCGTIKIVSSSVCQDGAIVGFASQLWDEHTHTHTLRTHTCGLENRIHDVYILSDCKDNKPSMSRTNADQTPKQIKLNRILLSTTRTTTRPKTEPIPSQVESTRLGIGHMLLSSFARVMALKCSPNRLPAPPSPAPPTSLQLPSCPIPVTQLEFQSQSWPRHAPPRLASSLALL